MSHRIDDRQCTVILQPSPRWSRHQAQGPGTWKVGAHCKTVVLVSTRPQKFRNVVMWKIIDFADAFLPKCSKKHSGFMFCWQVFSHTAVFNTKVSRCHETGAHKVLSIRNWTRRCTHYTDQSFNLHKTISSKTETQISKHGVVATLRMMKSSSTVKVHIVVLRST